MKTILIIDDVSINIKILVDLLSDKYDVIIALSGLEALEVLKQSPIDLILLDIMMPNIDGYEVCKKLKQNDKTKNIPIIFITAKIDEDSIEKAYEVGGVDYVTKPFKPRELLARVKMQLDLQETIKHLEYISSYDQLTNIYNRRKFFELAELLFKNEKENLYAVMIDIDRFKNINDTYGHDIGDKVISILAKTLSDMIDENSVLGRLGGEEFAILCHSKEQSSVKKRLEEIRKTVQEIEVFTDENQLIQFTISTGISKYKQEFLNIDQFLKEADNALYEAKGTGRNKTIFRD